MLTFGTDCRLASLTRYRFRDVIEGRPAYDDVQLVNGRRVDGREADPARTCSPDATLTSVTVPAATAGTSVTGPGTSTPSPN